MKLIRYQYPRSTGTRALNRLFEMGAPSFPRLGSFFDDALESVADLRQAPLDLYEDDQNYYARLELPGVGKDAIDLNLEEGVLSIRTIQSEATEDTEATYADRRALSVPDDVDSTKIAAGYEDGVLTVTLPKEVAPAAQRIEIK